MNKEKRKRYPKNWAFISADIRYNRANDRCERCGLPNGEIIQRLPNNRYKIMSFEELDRIQYYVEQWGSPINRVFKMLRISKVVLTVAHLDHNEQNNDYSNLLALCQKCHFNHDKEDNIKRKSQARSPKGGILNQSVS